MAGCSSFTAISNKGPDKLFVEGPLAATALLRGYAAIAQYGDRYAIGPVLAANLDQATRLAQLWPPSRAHAVYRSEDEAFGAAKQMSDDLRDDLTWLETRDE